VPRSVNALAAATVIAIAGASQSLPAFAKSSVRHFTGPTVDEQYGAVRVRIAVSNHRIVKVQAASAADSERSYQENSTAIPILRSETLSAQSANIDVVSGATQTSYAYIDSLASAIHHAKKAKSLHK